MKTKYTTKFNSTLYANTLEELDFHSAEASLHSLKDVVPWDSDIKNSVDLLAVAFDAAVINEFNSNDDGISAATAERIKEHFVHRPANIEHDRSRIIGHITNAAFTERDDHEIIYEVSSRSDIFNLSLGGVVYKMVDEEFANILSSSMGNSENGSTQISASWELGFNSFGVAIGNKKMSDCEIITDPMLVAALAPNLKAFGGDGYTEDNRRIFRVILGEVYPLGIGFTEQPAASVKGIHVSDPLEKTDNDSYSRPIAASIESPDNEGISQWGNLNVKTDNKKAKLMDLKQQILEALGESGIKDLSDASLASLQKEIVEAIKDGNETYLKEKKALSDANEKAEKDLKEMKSSLQELNGKLVKAEEEISEFKNKEEAEAIASAVNQRVEQIDEKFELDDECRKVVIDELKKIDPRSDEEFDSLASKLEVIWKDKNKETLKAAAKALELQVEERVQEALKQQESKGSKKEEDEELDSKEAAKKAVEDSQKEDESIANNKEGQKENQSLVEKFQSAFSEEDSIKVTY